MTPIAIVGRSGLFPKSSTLDDFWDNIVHQRDMTSEVLADKWRLNPQSVLGKDIDGVRSLRGGYVSEEISDSIVDWLSLIHI